MVPLCFLLVRIVFYWGGFYWHEFWGTNCRSEVLPLEWTRKRPFVISVKGVWGLATGVRCKPCAKLFT